MIKRDWSLVFFTTLAQWSVGIILCFTWAVFNNNNLDPVFATDLSLTIPVLAALIFIGVATLSSFLHLGNPANAHKALNNLSGSWLSREILAIGVFTLSLVFVLVLAWKRGHSDYLQYLLALSSVSGMALLWMMIRIYLIATIPPWYSWYTPVSFVATALSLGLITCLGLHTGGWVNMTDQTAMNFSVALGVILLIQIAAGISHQFRLEKLDPGMDEPVFDRGAFYRVFLTRMAVLILACLAMIMVTFKPDLLPGYCNSLCLYLLFVLIIAQELVGRVLFYSSYFRIGV